MPDPIELARRIWALFAQPSPPLREQFLQNLQNPGLLELPPGGEPIQDFSPFILTHMERVKNIQEQFNQRLRSGGTEVEGMDAVLDRFEELVGKENPDLLYYALHTFLIHYKGPLAFVIPSLIVSEPELVTPSKVPGQDRVAIAVGSTNETKLDWFRESPSLNEHHRHWHLVYTTNSEYDRQGEMFFFMHQQMLARYDAERMAENINRVEAYDDFRQNIEVGYAPGPDERLSRWVDSGRQPRARIPTQSAQRQRFYLSNILQDIDNGHYDPAGDNLTAETDAINTLGSTLEPNVHSQADRSRSYYNPGEGGYHGGGHVSIASINRGVMRHTVSAIRDVVFWEWHKGIDDLYFRLQQRLQPYDFTADAPPVLLRKAVDDDMRPYSTDLILVSGENLPESAEGQRIGALAFGGAQWEEDFEKGSFSYQDADGNQQTVETTDTLSTYLQQGRIRYRSASNGEQREYPYTYLMHEPFAYFIRVENTSLEQKQVTVRIFMVPEADMDRRMWIEMDKFLQELPPDSRTVIYRRDRESSVIRKPHVPDPAADHINFDPTNIQRENLQCDCGWPYHMLLPKGQSADEGMAFKLMVMISDAAIDLMEQEENCGSFSFCAARSANYPDRRPLGYPFNRPFPGGADSILQTIRSQDNMACRTIFIKHE